MLVLPIRAAGFVHLLVYTFTIVLCLLHGHVAARVVATQVPGQ